MKKFIQSEEEIIEEGIASNAFSVGIALYITKMLMTNIKNWDMYKFGLVDNKGIRTEKEAITSQEKESINLLNMFIMQLKRVFLFFISEGMLKILITLYLIKMIKK